MECPVGSAPLGLGAPPVNRTHGSTFCGAKPATEIGPPTIERACRRARVSAQSNTGPTGSPSAPTGTVEPHWAVIPTARRFASSRPASLIAFEVALATASTNATDHSTAS
jgi:hypothetical protein